MKNQTKAQPEPARIVGQGKLAGAQGGLPFVLVTSASEPGRVHVVSYSYEGAYVGARMHCDCVAASYGKHCRHAQLVADWLAAGLRALGLPYVAEEPSYEEAQAHLRETTATLKRLNTASAEHSGFGAKSAPRQALHAAQSGHPGDTAILRRSQQPFRLMA